MCAKDDVEIVARSRVGEPPVDQEAIGEGFADLLAVSMLIHQQAWKMFLKFWQEASLSSRERFFTPDSFAVQAEHGRPIERPSHIFDLASHASQACLTKNRFDVLIVASRCSRRSNRGCVIVATRQCSLRLFSGERLEQSTHPGEQQHSSGHQESDSPASFSWSKHHERTRAASRLSIRVEPISRWALAHG